MCTKESPEVGQKTYDVVLTPKVSSDHVKWWEQPRTKRETLNIKTDGLSLVTRLMTWLLGNKKKSRMYPPTISAIA